MGSLLSSCEQAHDGRDGEDGEEDEGCEAVTVEGMVVGPVDEIAEEVDEEPAVEGGEGDEEETGHEEHHLSRGGDQ